MSVYTMLSTFQNSEDLFLLDLQASVKLGRESHALMKSTEKPQRLFMRREGNGWADIVCDLRKKVSDCVLAGFCQ